MTLDEEEFNHPFPIEVESSSLTVNQTTGDWENNSDSPEEINGSISTMPETYEERGQHDRYQEGEAQFFSDAELEIDDIIIVYHDDEKNTSTKYKVTGIESKYDWFGDIVGDFGRAQYRLERVDAQ